jgi:CubicO group peptidase (beta-lactamase class C family)
MKHTWSLLFFSGSLLCALLAGWSAAAAPTRVFPGARWEEATPESQDVDAKKLEAATRLLAATVGSDGVRELVIIRHGRLIWKGGGSDRRHGVWSATKSFTSTVLGLLIEDGKCTLDTRAADLLPALRAHYPEVTLRHFTTMTSGYRAIGDETTGSYRHGPSDTPFLPHAKPLFTPPGSQYAYWDSAMNVLALALTKIAGEPIEDLFRRRVAEPIGMKDWDWGDYAAVDGLVVNGGSGNGNKHIFITARELARFGWLVLNQGNWNGHQLLSAKWVAEATRVQVPATMPWAHPESDIDGRGVYGFNWWRNGLKPDGTRKFPDAPEGMFWASGHNNNQCFVIPEWDMVIVRLGLDGQVRDQVWDQFLGRIREAVQFPASRPRTTAPAAESSFPPPESQGGWRRLVAADRAATDEQKRAVREKTGLDWDKLKAAQDYCASFGTPNNLLVIRHGWIAGEWTSFSDPRGIASCTKSLTALAMAKVFDLSDAGKLSVRVGIDDEAWRFLPAHWAEAEPARKAIRLRHLLSMSSGLTPYDGPYQADYLQQIFAQKLEAQPGKVWAYASVPVDLLSLIIEKVTGRSEAQFFNQEINAAIGAVPVQWGQFSGHTGGSGGPEGGARFPARELARVGYLVLKEGAWAQSGERRQIISPSRIRQITQWAPVLAEAHWRVPNFASETNANGFYGHLWWNNRTGRALGETVPRDAVYMSGWGKQACFVVPSLDLVVVRLGAHRKLNDHPEFYGELWKRLMAALLDGPPKASSPSATPQSVSARPFDGQNFKGRIAYSADGNHNDPDDWIASPVTLAILAEADLKDRLVHFDYNCILGLTRPEWERTHAQSVLGAAERYGFDTSLFLDCRRQLDAAVANIAKAINDSTADNPLYFIIAGPMEVPYRGIRESDPAKRQFVYCISHSRWNDGFASNYKFAHTKRSVIEQNVRWVQIADQNRRLSFGHYGQPSPPEEFKPYLWMRDSPDAKVRWLWERMLVSTRPDPSDAGMTWFLVTGDEACDPAKLRQHIGEHRPAIPTVERSRVRIEAENFRHLDGCVLEDRNDKQASHGLNTRLVGGTTGRIRTRFAEPFTRATGHYNVEIRYFEELGQRCRFALYVNGLAPGEEWESAGEGRGWTSHIIRGVEIRADDEIRVDADGAAGRLDYVQLNLAPGK